MKDTNKKTNTCSPNAAESKGLFPKSHLSRDRPAGLRGRGWVGCRLVSAPNRFPAPKNFGWAAYSRTQIRQHASQRRPRDKYSVALKAGPKLDPVHGEVGRTPTPTTAHVSIGSTLIAQSRSRFSLNSAAARWPSSTPLCSSIQLSVLSPHQGNAFTEQSSEAATASTG